MNRPWGLVLILVLTSCIAAQDRREGSSRSDASGFRAVCQSENLVDCLGSPIQGGFDADPDKQTIEISFVFINSSSEQLSFNANNDADRIVSSLNQEFRFQNHQHLKFSRKGGVEEVSNDLYTNTECDNLESVLNLYGKTDSLTFVVVNDLADNCRGVAKLWTDPNDPFSGLLLEYNRSIEANAHVYAHEIGHNIGLHHSARTYAESAPVSGLYSFNELVGYGGTLMSRCEYDFLYFIDPRSQSYNSVESGVSFNSYQNTMYPSFGDGVSRNFFTEGYDYSMTNAFDCWYNLVKQSGIGVASE